MLTFFGTNVAICTLSASRPAQGLAPVCVERWSFVTEFVKLHGHAGGEAHPGDLAREGAEVGDDLAVVARRARDQRDPPGPRPSVAT